MLNIKKLLAKIVKQQEIQTFNHTQFTYNNGFEAYATGATAGDTPKAYKCGNVVTLMGTYRKVGAQTSSSNLDITIGKVPEGCQPSATVRFVEQGSGQNRFVLQILSDRTMTVRRYGVASNVVLGNDAWINIFCTYITKA